MIEQSIEKLCDILTKQWAESRYSNTPKLIYSKGKKYYKLIQDDHRNSNRSVYCFIDVAGNVYKASSWTVPAKGIRFHIDQLLETPELCDMFGSFLYKR